MPPEIPLFLCILFIFILFRIELKEESKLFSALWVPLIWMMVCASRSFSYWIYPELLIATGKRDYLAGNATDRAFLTALIFLGLYILSKRKIEWQKVLRSNTWIFALFIYMGLSIFWSDYKSVSFKRWIRNIGDLIMVMIVLTEPDPLEAIKRLFRRSAIVLIPLSVLFIKYFRKLGVKYDPQGYEMWVGVTLHKNSLGALAMITMIFCIWNIIITRGWKEKSKEFYINIGLIIMSLWLLIGSTNKSKTSIGVFIIGLILLTLFYVLKYNVKYSEAYILFGAFLFLSLYETLIPLIVTASGGDLTLTGRTYLWKDLIKIGSRHEFLGAGYGSFWIGNLSNNLWLKYIWRPRSAHSGYVDIYVELGLVGVFILIGMIMNVYRKIKKSCLSDMKMGGLRMTFLFIILVYNITESSFVRPMELMWFLFLLFALDIPYSIGAHTTSIGSDLGACELP
jgi:O-antigen ligase